MRFAAANTRHSGRMLPRGAAGTSPRSPSGRGSPLKGLTVRVRFPRGAPHCRRDDAMNPERLIMWVLAVFVVFVCCFVLLRLVHAV